MSGRLAFFLLIGSLALAVCALAYDWRATLTPEQATAMGWRAGLSDAEILDEDLAWYVNDQKIANRVSDAVQREDAGDAMLYLDMARELGIPLAAGLEAAALTLQAREDSVEQQFSDYLAGFASGSGDTVAGLAGAISSDLTVYGDVRDIILEGGKMIAGEPYSEFILGLSAVGLAATVGTVATGGGGVVVKAGLSLAKFAKRTGHLTAGFAASLTRLADEAIDMPQFKRTLRELDLTDPVGAWSRLTAYATRVRGARIFDVLAKMEDIRAAVGTAEALRLLKRIDRIEDVDDIHSLARVAGKRTRGVIELTGKTSFRAVKYTANVLQIAFKYVWPMALWFGGLLAAIAVRCTISAWRLGRALVRFVSASGPATSLTVR